MMKEKRLQLPLGNEAIEQLRAGDFVLLSGILYTGRDAAHIRMRDAIEKGEPLPVDLTGQVIYYVGPAPARPGQVVGSAGPTSAYRMDGIAPLLLDRGLKGMIGKGLRGAAVIESMKKNRAVYFTAVGGAAALISKSIVSSEVVAYEDLGPEAIHRYEIQDFPVFVTIDANGNNSYETGPAGACGAMKSAYGR
jgi:fumarate hydratase subunit beta